MLNNESREFVKGKDLAKNRIQTSGFDCGNKSLIVESPREKKMTFHICPWRFFRLKNHKFPQEISPLQNLRMHGNFKAVTSHKGCFNDESSESRETGTDPIRASPALQWAPVGREKKQACSQKGEGFRGM